MTALSDIIKKQIKRFGPMPVSEYMTLCLLHPEHGYYTNRDALGATGDFTTAPEISQMFGELIGLSIAQSWIDQEMPTPFILAELGPGNGTLLADILRATKSVPTFHSSIDLPLIEASPEMMEKINAFSFAVHDENGVERDTGSMANWYKPLDVVRWLRDHVHTSGKLLQPGQLLSLGNIGIIRQLHENSPRGPAYQSNAFILSYYDLSDTPISVTININRQ